MIFALHGTTNTVSTSRSPSITFTGYAPAIGDFIFFFVNDNGGTANVTIPSGWTNVLGGTTTVASDAHQVIAIYHEVTSSEVSAGTTAYTATNLFDTNIVGRVNGCVLRGVNTSLVVDATGTTFDSSAATPHVIAGLTGTDLLTGSLVLGCVSGDGAGTYTNPSGWTLVVKNPGGTTMTAIYSNNSLTTAGTNVSSTNITPSVSDEYASITVAVTPAPNKGIEFIDANGSVAASISTMPTHKAGDLLLIQALRTNATPPSTASGWNSLATVTNTSISARLGYKFAQSSSETSGTWTNAGAVICYVYRGAATPGTPSTNTGSSTSIGYPAVTLSTLGDTSWVHRCCHHFTATDTETTAFPDYAARTGNGFSFIQQWQRGWDSNTGLTSSPGTGTQTVNTSGQWTTFSVEIPADTTEFFHMF